MQYAGRTPPGEAKRIKGIGYYFLFFRPEDARLRVVYPFLGNFVQSLVFVEEVRFFREAIAGIE
jgi:hypothetical protein